MLKRVTDASKACELIQTDGWATSISYATSLKNLIKQNLTDWDLQVLESANDEKQFQAMKLVGIK